MIKKSVKKFFTTSLSLLTVCTMNFYSLSMESKDYKETSISVMDRNTLNQISKIKEGNRKTLEVTVSLRKLEDKSGYAILDSNNSVVNCLVCLNPLKAGQTAFVCACEDVFNPSHIIK